MRNRALRIALVAIVPAIGFIAALLRSSPEVVGRTESPLSMGISARVFPPSAGRADVPRDGAPNSFRILVMSGGKAISDASVTLLHEESHQQMDFRTQADGSQRILALPEGVYDIGVCYPGYVFATAHHHVGRGKAEELVMDLQRGARIEGRVQDRSGRPLAGATVLLVEPQGGPPIAHDLSAQVGASGDYRIDGIPLGPCDLRICCDGYRSRTLPGLSLSGPGEVLQVDVVLEEGRRIAGRVLSETGQPIPGATVVGSNGETVTGRSGETGSFALQGLGDGPVHCFASAAGFGVAFLRGVRVGEENLEFRLPRAAFLSGQIDVWPLPDRFKVQLSRFDPDLAGYFPLYGQTFEGAGGENFRLPEISPGRYRVEVQADGYEAQDIPEVTVASGEALVGLMVRLRKK